MLTRLSTGEWLTSSKSFCTAFKTLLQDLNNKTCPQASILFCQAISDIEPRAGMKTMLVVCFGIPALSDRSLSSNNPHTDI